jgi:hypothetical protein
MRAPSQTALPSNAVTSAANRKNKIVLACKADTCDDVSRAGTARNEGGPPVDHGVRNSSDRVIALLTRAQ